MKSIVKALIKKATEFSRQVDIPNPNMLAGLEGEYLGRTVPVDYNKLKEKTIQKTKQTDFEYNDQKGNTKTS
jgi:hypothetical protein